MLDTLLSLFFPKELNDCFDLKSHQENEDERGKAMSLELTFLALVGVFHQQDLACLDDWS
jgi:hypothetical protein